jgi:hypothetical protein
MPRGLADAVNYDLLASIDEGEVVWSSEKATLSAIDYTSDSKEKVNTKIRKWLREQQQTYYIMTNTRNDIEYDLPSTFGNEDNGAHDGNAVT